MGTVIKVGESSHVLRRLSPVKLTDHLAEAHAVLDEARHEAREIAAEARRKSVTERADVRESGRQTGYDEGYAEGTTAGYKAAHDEAVQRFEKEQADLSGALKGAFTEIDSMKRELAIAAERDLLEFAVLLAEKLTFAIGSTRSESVIENVRRSLRVVGSQTDLVIRVNPKDKQSLEVFADSVLRQAEGSSSVSIVADEAIRQGGCTVKTAGTSVDARLETQVDEIVALLLGKRE